MLPSAERIRKDMKAYEKKFYERYLSQGYKICECPTCKTLSLKFMITENGNPQDYWKLHSAYLQRKQSKGHVVMKDGLYQNQTVVILQKRHA